MCTISCRRGCVSFIKPVHSQSLGNRTNDKFTIQRQTFTDLQLELRVRAEGTSSPICMDRGQGYSVCGLFTGFSIL